MFQNRIGLYLKGNMRLKINWASLQHIFTETRLEDVDLSKPQPCKYFVYMDRGNLSH